MQDTDPYAAATMSGVQGSAPRAGEYHGAGSSARDGCAARRPPSPAASSSAASSRSLAETAAASEDSAMAGGARSGKVFDEMAEREREARNGKGTLGF
jgi:hypothetical protein